MCVHTELINMLNDELKKQKYMNYTLENEHMCECGFFVTVRYKILDKDGYKTFQKIIIGIIPLNSNSIYTRNEQFNIVDLTEDTEHFIHRYYENLSP